MHVVCSDVEPWRRAMVLLLAEAPAEAAAVLAPEVYSGHVDMFQRLLVRPIAICVTVDDCAFGLMTTRSVGS